MMQGSIRMNPLHRQKKRQSAENERKRGNLIMAKEIIFTEKAPKAVGPYVQAVKKDET